jgi:hypothetical protein
MRRGRPKQGQQWDTESIENIVADLKLIQQNSSPGKTRHDLRHIASPMREIAVDDRLLHAWRKLGLPNTPSIPCSCWTGRGVNESSIAISGGGEDTPQDPSGPSIDFGSIAMVGVTESGEEVELPPSHAMSSIVFNGTHDNTMSNDNAPFVDGALPISKFFRDCTIYYQGLKISRTEIVQHVATGRDGVHYSRSGLRDTKKADALEFLSSGIIHNRDVVFYVYLSIAQTLSRAPDIALFIEAAEKILAERRS